MDGKYSVQDLPQDALRRRLTLSGGLVALGLAACSGESAPPATSEKRTTIPAALPAPKRVDAPDLEAHGLLLPGLIDSASEGAFIDLIKAIDEAYSEGSIAIRVFPSARLDANVAQGVSDFAFPVMRLGPEAEAKMPYRFSTESLGRVSFVLYSHRDQPLDRQQLIDAARRDRAFRVQAPDSEWGFPTQRFIDFAEAFRLLDARRIDGFLWAQEEADLILRRLGLKSIHREHFQDYEDVLWVPKTARGDFVDQVLTRVIRSMRESGTLATHYARVHRAYQNWQPYRDS